MDITLVSCAKCKGLIPDPIGDGFGVGNCKVYEHYKAKGLSQKGLHDLFEKLGGKVFYRGNDDRDDRNCSKFLSNEIKHE